MGGMPHECPECKKSFRLEKTLTAHIASTHPAEVAAAEAGEVAAMEDLPPPTSSGASEYDDPHAPLVAQPAAGPGMPYVREVDGQWKGPPLDQGRRARNPPRESCECGTLGCQGCGGPLLIPKAPVLRF
jgi:hypothetical protein